MTQSIQLITPRKTAESGCADGIQMARNLQGELERGDAGDAAPTMQAASLDWKDDVRQWYGERSDKVIVVIYVVWNSAFALMSQYSHVVRPTPTRLTTDCNIKNQRAPDHGGTISLAPKTITLKCSKAFFETQKSGVHEFAKAFCRVSDEVGFSPRVEMYFKIEMATMYPCGNALVAEKIRQFESPTMLRFWEQLDFPANLAGLE
ncbi:hypothetical protein HO173_010808 [Letharia columbiana]|uniref:Uncharacterized protein n=1 Tax=Letharia columbiana TaxID=112416 RepID=A0A8H6FM78_9LECA|nr:uncharacterized protein HO173_010808 [Letharia columbiana]KAF6231108.1 hypothetical protein HO173_010808 [Letharia columbiana]